MSEPQKRKLAAILFADIVGYTALMQKDEQSASTLLRHFQKAKKVCNEANYLSAEEGLLLESIEQEAIKGTKNQIEAVMAAMQKRAAKFEDYREK